ncbi:serine/threonine-protein phosphatase 6 regulatory ankyrin repeat subunit C-like [Haliotis cracherodii]|uniref:serine/threonine-protein phosphatase 6 regulatory ankyrin repeat subunit C-like n=1 Tax=Haliotis cracherodii TaxID=6455 RepID=UPI0039EC5444
MEVVESTSGCGVIKRMRVDSANNTQVEAPVVLSDGPNLYNIKDSTVTLQETNYETPNYPLQNIIDSTEMMIKREDSDKHISTYAERSALRHLKNTGCVFLKGRSGTGKSRVALSLLSQVGKETERKPLLLSFPQQWKDIPVGKSKGKYVVLIDDIFGSSNLFQSQVDDWSKVLKIMNAVVESGNIFLVLTSRPEISAQCEKKMKTHELFKRIKCVTLDDGEFSLRVSEKQKLLEKYFGRKIRLSEKEMTEIAEMKTSLGFPQCCTFFASDKLPASKAVSFFRNPQTCLKESLDCLKECEPLRYFVLLLVMSQKGFLEHKLLKSRKDRNFSDLVAELSTFCDIPAPPGYGQIASKAVTLSGVYLLNTKNGYEFQHQSIYDAVFLDLADEDPEMCIKICPAQMLVELVRTQSAETEEDGVVTRLSEEHYEILADRITNILLSEDGSEILNHPSLHDKEFLPYLETKLEQDVCEAIVKRKTTSSSITYYPDITNMLEPHVLFTYRFLLSHMAMKQSTLAKYILLKTANIPEKVLKEFIICAVYQSHNDIINMLLDRGAVLDEPCVRALSASQSIDGPTSMRLLDLISTGWEGFQDRLDMVLLASLNGNVDLVKRIIDTAGDGSQDLCYRCLSALLKELTNNTEYHNLEWIEKRRQSLEEILHLLFNRFPDMEEVAQLVHKCAGYVYPVALKIVIDKCTFHKVDNHNMKECLQIACENGGGECVRIFLEHMTITESIYDNIADCICLSAASTTDSCLKIQLLLNFIDKLCANIGDIPSHSQTLNRIFGVFTPLTKASQQGNVDTVKMLIQKGADVNMEDGQGCTPLLSAVGWDSLPCVTVLLEFGALVNKSASDAQPVLLRANRLDIVQKLVAAKCDINATDEEGKSALHTAALFNNLNILKFLCSKGCNVDQPDEGGVTAFHVAAEYGEVDMVKYLHKMHAKPTVDVDGWSLLHYACFSVSEAMEKVQFLVDTVKVPVDTRDHDGRTVLYPAVQTTGLEVVEFLVERGLSLRDRDNDGNTYLHAVFLRYSNSIHDEVVKFLFKANVDPDLYNSRDRRTPLHLALDSGLWHFFEDHMMTLIDRTSNINHRDSEGKTPLHIAAYHDASKFVKRLLDKGADKDIKDSDGCKAIDLIPEGGNGEVKALLSPSELPTCD